MSWCVSTNVGQFGKRGVLLQKCSHHLSIKKMRPRTTFLEWRVKLYAFACSSFVLIGCFPINISCSIYTNFIIEWKSINKILDNQSSLQEGMPACTPALINNYHKCLPFSFFILVKRFWIFSLDLKYFYLSLLYTLHCVCKVYTLCTQSWSLIISEKNVSLNYLEFFFKFLGILFCQSAMHF